MKHAKKLLALALAFAMALALAVPAFAADPVPIPGTNVSIELPRKPSDVKPGEDGSGTDNVADHTFNAYQIFSAKYANEVPGSAAETDEDQKELVGIKWGSGVNPEAFLDALKGNSAFVKDGKNLFADITYEANDDAKNVNPSALAVAEIVSTWGEGSAEALAFAAAADANKTEIYAEEGTILGAGYYLIVDATEGGLRNLSTLTMSNADTPFDPKVKVDVPEMEKKVLEINDSDNQGGNAPHWADVADYDIDDVVPFVLTGTVPADYSSYTKYRYVFHDTLSAGFQFNAESVQVYVNGSLIGSAAYEVKTADLADDESFTVAFADLKTVLPDASVTADTTIQVLYTATLTGENVVVGGNGNLNTAHLEYSNDPNFRGDGEPPTGNTPDDPVAVFTFQLDAGKVDENEQPLSGAAFTLYKFFVNAEDAPENAEIVTAEGKTYYAVQTLTSTEENPLTAFNFKGLDAGSYMLRETTAPEGYNKAEDMYFTVTATEGPDDKGGYEVTSLDVSPVTNAKDEEYKNGDDPVFTIKADKVSGIMGTAIVNLRGLQLPSTGGIGTTIFYVVGGLLLVGAAVVLITKKRMSSAE